MKIKNILYKNFLHFFIIITIASITGYFSDYHFLADICSHFRVQYFIFGVLSIIIFCFLKKPKTLIVIVFLLTLSNFFEFLPYVKFFNENKTSDLKVGLLNLYTPNKQYDNVRNELKNSKSDILIVQEIDDIWSSELFEVKKMYEYTYEITRDDNFGIAVYSNIPVTGLKKINTGFFETPVMSVLCNKNGKEFEVIAIHTTPPISQPYFLNTKKMFEDLAEYISLNGRETIVAGDINSSMFSSNYKNFVKKSKLKDSGTIFQPTWTAYWFKIFRIPLDHIFTTKSFKIKSFSVGNKVGSDHFPVYAEILFNDGELLN